MDISQQRVAIVVPTKDRPRDLALLLESLAAQTRQVAQIVIVDGSDPDIRHVLDGFPGLPLTYVRVFPPSLAKQRNAGMAALRDDITIAGYLDDDIVVEPAAVERMLEFWAAAAPDVGGASFNITNLPQPPHVRLRSFFQVDGPVPGRVLASGCPSSFTTQDKDLETDWLFGGATLWRREVIAAYPYDEWFKGMGFMEDVEFSFRVREKYRLVLVAGARLAHNCAPVRADRQYLLGQWQVVNRMYFVRKFLTRGLSLAKAWWASIGLLAMHLGAFAVSGNRQYWDRARGNFAGIVAELRNARPQLGGHLK